MRLSLGGRVTAVRRPVPTGPCARAYVRDGRTPVTKAVFVVGDTEVNLTLCHCVSVDDVIAETEAWAERVVASPSPRA